MSSVMLSSSLGGFSHGTKIPAYNPKPSFFSHISLLVASRKNFPYNTSKSPHIYCYFMDEIKLICLTKSEAEGRLKFPGPVEIKAVNRG
jgi:hypothetical protein